MNSTNKAGWEGVPFNLGMNICLFLTAITTFSLLRNRASNNRSKQLTRLQKGWLQFIYGDREHRDIVHERQQPKEIHRHNMDYPGLIFTPSFLATLDVDEGDIDETTGSDFLKRIEGDEDKSDEEDFERQERKAEYFHKYIPDIKLVRRHRTMSTESLNEMGYWVIDLLMIRDDQIYRQKGKDAVQYLIFQRYIIYFLILLTVVSMVIVLPVNLQGREAQEEQLFLQTTIMNIPQFSPYLWVHVILAIVLHPIGTYIMCQFSQIIEAQEENTCAKTLFIRGIPQGKRSKQNIISFLHKKIPDLKIVAAQFVFDTRALKNMKLEHSNVLNAKYYCEEYIFEFNERFEGRPYVLGKFAGLLCCCYCCPKVDGLEYYSDRERRLEKEIEREYEKCISNPQGSLFITLETEEMAEHVQSFIKFQRKQANYWFLICSFIYRTFVWLKSCCKRETDDFNIHNWVVNFAPFPDDMNWADIPVEFGMIWLRRIVVNVWLFLIFFFFSTPTIVLKSYTDFGGSGAVMQKITNFSPFLTAYMSPLLLMLAAAILPTFVILASEMLPYTTISDKNHSIMVKTFLFLVMMTVILPSLGYTSAMAVFDLALGANKTFPWANITTGTGSLFTNYVIHSALLGNAMELLRIPELFLYFFYVNFFSSTVAEYESARTNVIFEFQFGVLYARLLLIFFMVITYSLSCPIIVPFGLLYMLVKHFVDRFNIYNVYSPSRISVRMHSTAITFFHLSILTMQFQIFAIMYFRESFSNKTSVLMFALLLGVTVFTIHFFYGWIRNLFTFKKSKKKSRRRQEWCACYYAPTVLYELTNRGIVALDMNSIRNQFKQLKERNISKVRERIV